MATVVLGVVGAAIELVATHGTRWQEGWAIGTVVGGIIEGIGPRQEVGKLTDLRVTGSSYGVAIPRMWGKNKVGGNIIWVANYRNNSELVPSGSYVLLTCASGGAQGATTITVTSSVDEGTLPAATYFTDKGHPIRTTAETPIEAGVAVISCDPLDEAITAGEVFSTTAAVTHLVEHTSNVSAGGGSGAGGAKGGGGTQYWYSASYQVCFGEATQFGDDGVFRGHNPVIKKLWANDLLIYDADNVTINKTEIRFYYGAEDQEPDTLIVQAESPGDASKVPANRGLITAVIVGQDLTQFGSALPNLTAEIWTEAITVADIITDTLTQVNLPTTSFDVSDADTYVTGYLLPERYTAQDSITNLIKYYAIDLSEFDGKLNFVARGASSVVTLDLNHLGAYAENSVEEPIVTLTRNCGVRSELPGKIDIVYSDVQKGFAQSTQSAIKTTGAFSNPISINLTLSLFASEAKQIASRILDTTYLELDPFTFNLPWNYLYLVPSDNVTLVDEGISYRLRITQIDEAESGELRCSAVQDDPSILEQNDGSDDGYGGDTGTVTVPVMFGAWCKQALQEEDKEIPGFYAWATWASNGAGGTVFYSPDSGATWIQGPNLVGRTPFGKITSGGLYASGGGGVWDHASEATVKLTNDGGVTKLGSVSEEELLAGQNIALINDEVVGFLTVASAGYMAYTLSDFKRGLLDSNASVATTDATFVVLTKAAKYVRVKSGLVGLTVLVKVVANGQVLSDVVAKNVYIYPPTEKQITIGLGVVAEDLDTLTGTVGGIDDRVTALEGAGGFDFSTYDGVLKVVDGDLADTSVLEDLSNVNITTVDDGDALVWDSATSKWVNAVPASGGATTVEELTDVNVTSIADDNILQWDAATSKWINVAPPNPGTGFTGSVTVGQIVVASGTNALGGSSSLTFTGGVLKIGTLGGILKASSGDVSGSAALEDLSNANIASITDGQLLTWNSSTSKWVNVDRSVVAGTAVTPNLSVAAFTKGSTADFNATGVVDYVVPSNGELPYYTNVGFSYGYRKITGYQILGVCWVKGGTRFAGGSGTTISCSDAMTVSGSHSISSTDHTGIYNNGNTVGLGYVIMCLASTKSRKLKIYGLRYKTGITVTAKLSDGSVATVTNTSLSSNASGWADCSYEITFNSKQEGVILTVYVEVTSTGASDGNITFAGASLTDV